MPNPTRTPRQKLEAAMCELAKFAEDSHFVLDARLSEFLDRESGYTAMAEALKGILPLCEKLFNNTATAAVLLNQPLTPAGVKFDDLKFVQRGRAALEIVYGPEPKRGEV